MYQLVYVNFGHNGEQGALIGDLHSLFLVFHNYFSHKHWDKLELWSLGHMTYEIAKDGKRVPWWNQHVNPQ